MRLYGCNCVFLCAGDEVVILEPAFDLYAAQTVVAGANSCLCVLSFALLMRDCCLFLPLTAAGGVCKFVPLRVRANATTGEQGVIPHSALC